MKKFFNSLVRGAASIAVLALCLFLIIASILKDFNWDWLHPQAQTAQLNLPRVQKSRSDEISNYVLFTTVKYEQFNVVTGTRFATTRTKKITGQWCYLQERSRGDTGFALYIAKTGGADRPTNTFNNNDELARFKMSRASTSSLVKTHCRFK